MQEGPGQDAHTAEVNGRVLPGEEQGGLRCRVARTIPGSGVLGKRGGSGQGYTVRTDSARDKDLRRQPPRSVPDSRNGVTPARCDGRPVEGTEVSDEWGGRKHTRPSG